MSLIILIVALTVAGVLAFTPSIRASRAWKATVTPLSSIMGSGFLISAPLLAGEAGLYAPAAMAGLLLVAFAIGAMVRFNIRYAEPMLGEADGQKDDDDREEHRLHRGHQRGSAPHWRTTARHVTRSIERVSHVILTGAYLVSVSYYIQLLSAFVLDCFGAHQTTWSPLSTTAILALLTVVGALWGLRALENLERYAVSLNLGTIVALLVGLAVHDGDLAIHGSFALPALQPDADLLHGARVMMGLLVVVQGFETSRFIGSEHPPEERVCTMRRAQLLASVIYLSFVTLMLPLLDGRLLGADVTAIVRLVSPVAVVLPTLIVVAAVGSQFSAAVADDAGCAGLSRTLLSKRLSSRYSYLLIGGATIGLTWLTDVLSVISLASRAFAAFYSLQCLVAVVTAYTREDLAHRRWLFVGGSVLALVSLSITVFGLPAE